ncbi:hypothetical protein AMK59_919 [Oryctes borbonicus]|uniref:Uncharacterized protein n=1 Tax=Oryctes borbonicus TaxID=1629725 RepID=A0A0T6BGP3_9SCAR|nr:hypothetical protein AMK59_919 [Oryctes borbonicus]
MIENVDVEKLPADIKGYCTDSIMRSPGVILATIKVDNVRGDNIVIRIVLDNAQLVDVIIGRTYTKLPRAGYCKVDNYLHFQHRDDLDPFQMKIINTVKPLQLMSALFSKVCKCELNREKRYQCRRC